MIFIMFVKHLKLRRSVIFAAGLNHGLNRFNGLHGFFLAPSILKYNAPTELDKSGGLLRYKYTAPTELDKSGRLLCYYKDNAPTELDKSGAGFCATNISLLRSLKSLGHHVSTKITPLWS